MFAGFLLSNSFLQNKAAVAGTFSAVAIVALVILAFVATAAIRKRRARKFDDEVEQAAAEAAKATDRAYMDDEDDFRGAASMHTGYSDATHGTYAQGPMGVESYNMRELQPAGYGVTGGYGDEHYASSGVIAGAMQRSKSTRDAGGEPIQPYAAFAGPPYETNIPNHDYTSGSGDPYAPAATYQHNTSPTNRQADLLDAAGLGDASMADNPARRSAADAAQQSGVSLSRSPSQVPTINHGGGLHRNKSITLEQGFFDPSAPPVPDLVAASAPPGLARTKSSANALAASKETYADRYAPDVVSVPLARNKSAHSAGAMTVHTGSSTTAHSGSGITSNTSPSRPSSMLDPYGGVTAAEGTRESYADAYAPDSDIRRSRVMSYDSDSDDDDISPPRHRPEHASQVSFRDDEDYGYNGGARVLRVSCTHQLIEHTLMRNF
jgi:hypothetical protein